MGELGDDTFLATSWVPGTLLKEVCAAAVRAWLPCWQSSSRCSAAGPKQWQVCWCMLSGRDSWWMLSGQGTCWMLSPQAAAAVYLQVHPLTTDIKQAVETAVAQLHHHHVVHGDLSGTHLLLVEGSPSGSPGQSSGGGRLGSGSGGSDSSQPCTEVGSGSSVVPPGAADNQGPTGSQGPNSSSRVVVLNFGTAWVSDDIERERHHDLRRLRRLFARLGTCSHTVCSFHSDGEQCALEQAPSRVAGSGSLPAWFNPMCRMPRHHHDHGHHHLHCAVMLVMINNPRMCTSQPMQRRGAAD
jgi:hypothetical protein